MLTTNNYKMLRIYSSLPFYVRLFRSPGPLASCMFSGWHSPLDISFTFYYCYMTKHIIHYCQILMY